MNYPINELRIALAQTNIVDVDSEANLKQIEQILQKTYTETDLVVFPEAMLSGFSTEAMQKCIKWEGLEIRAIQSLAKQYSIAIAGSLFVEDNGQYFNRFILCDEAGSLQWQDKKHLFRLGSEPQYIQPSEEHKILTFKGWRILPLVCYDLRFPVWCRNQGNAYDLIICVANWPRGRRDVWSTLLRARAMENLSAVVGVNRIGTDLEGLSYSGDSALINPRGEMTVGSQREGAECLIGTLFYEDISKLRNKFPVWQDADAFTIH